MKLLDGLTSFFHVSNDTAIPAMPEYPSPPPLTPSAVGTVVLAFARVRVSPSAPEPEPMKASKATLIPVPGTGVGEKAEPACQFVAAVSCKLAGDALVLSTDVPLSCQLPDTGEGME
jgi:hypothetical protein